MADLTLLQSSASAAIADRRIQIEVNLGVTGPTGPTGATGAAGSDGADGADGKTILSGSGAPSGGTGVDGDFYIDTAAYDIYGPKTGGSWGSPTSLIGPAGAGSGNVNNSGTPTNGQTAEWTGTTTIQGINAGSTNGNPYVKRDGSDNFEAGTPTASAHVATKGYVDGLVAAPVPVGSLVIWPTNTAPSGWILCQGQEISRTTFATLFGVIGTIYGVGDGSTTFNLPDLRQRFPLGKAASGTGSTLASVGGAIDHTHTSAAHSHGVGTLAVASHTHAAGTLAAAAHTHGAGTYAVSAHSHAKGTLAVASHSHGVGTLAVDSHSHGVGSLAVASHTHGVGTLATVSAGAHTHSIGSTTDSVFDGTDAPFTFVDDVDSDTGSAGAHTHTLSGATASTAPSLSGSTGSDAPGINGSTASVAPAISGSTANATPTLSGASASATAGVTGNTGATAPGLTGATASVAPAATGSNNPPFIALNYIIKS